MTFLICRTAWMPHYKSSNEPANSHHTYIRENRPFECYNFLRSELGDFLGYVRVGGDADGNLGKLNIDRLGASKSDEKIDSVTVIFCATNPKKGSLYVVGYYNDATVFRTPLDDKAPNGDRRITRIRSTSATLIPEADRVLRIPSSPNGVGQSDVWYGVNEPENAPLREELTTYIDHAQVYADVDDDSVEEHRQRKTHEGWEGRASCRHFIHKLGFKCQACGYSVDADDQKIWGSGLELHHLAPWSDMEEGESRTLRPDDFAVLCAICHKAIHQTDDVFDVAAFVEKHLNA